jgi:hypothetical protein
MAKGDEAKSRTGNERDIAKVRDNSCNKRKLHDSWQDLEQS